MGIKYSLPSREIIAASTEIMLQAHRFDGAVFLSSCDKATPGMLMAAARVDIPSVFVPAGRHRASRDHGSSLTLTSMRDYTGCYQRSDETADEMAAVEEVALPGVGTCAMLGTANTMACLTEAMGLTLAPTFQTLSLKVIGG